MSRNDLVHLIGAGDHCNACKLALHLEAAAVIVLNSLDEENEGELRNNVQECPANLDDRDIRQDSKALWSEKVENRKGKPGDHHSQGCPAEVRLSTEQPLFSVAVFEDLKTVEVELHGLENDPDDIENVVDWKRCQLRHQSAKEEEQR